MMHPAMAVWIWSMAMGRAWQTSVWDGARVFGFDKPDDTPLPPGHRGTTGVQPRLVLANSYLCSEIAEKPLPDTLLDRLADLYWTERDEEMAI